MHECNSGKKTAGLKYNRLLDSVFTILKYNKITMYHVNFIKVFSDGKVSYLTVSTGDVINNTNNKTAFTEITRVFDEMKFQEGPVVKYLNFRIFQYPLGLSVDQSDHIKKLVNECFPTVTFRNVETSFRKDSTYEKELIAVITLTVNALHKSEIEYNGKFGHNLGRIQNISIMSRIDICYIA